MKCKICQSEAIYFGEAKILDRYMVRFYRCVNCGFIQTEEPYWLDEAYSSTITKSDIGLVSRNLEFSNVAKNLILVCFNPTQKFIDYGSGYGLFVRLMRDRGFDFYCHDPLCENLFASGFDACEGIHYELLTAWEVFEHLVDPIADIEKMLKFSDTILFSTLLLPQNPKPLGSWWYYGLEHGQHISFYSKESIKYISQKFNLKNHYSNGTIHFIGSSLVNPLLVRIVFDPRLKRLRKIISKHAPPSLLESDYHIVTGKYLK